MEGSISYTDKVRNSESARFDPMLEEARCAHPDENDGRTGDVEMALKAVMSANGDSDRGPHPVKTTPGETLPEGYSRSYAGFLLRDEKRVVQVN